MFGDRNSWGTDWSQTHYIVIYRWFELLILSSPFRCWDYSHGSSFLTYVVLWNGTQSFLCARQAHWQLNYKLSSNFSLSYISCSVFFPLLDHFDLSGNYILVTTLLPKLRLYINCYLPLECSLTQYLLQCLFLGGKFLDHTDKYLVCLQPFWGSCISSVF